MVEGRGLTNSATPFQGDLLRMAPYWYTRSVEDKKRVTPKRLLAVSYGEPTEMVLIDEVGEVVSFLSIFLIVSNNHNAPMSALSTPLSQPPSLSRP